MSHEAAIPYRNAAEDNAAEALRHINTGLDHLTALAPDELEPAAVGEVLTALSNAQGRLAAVQASLLHRFDAADAHDADGYASASAWLAGRGGMTGRAAKAAVMRMRQFTGRPLLHAAVAAGPAAGGISESWAQDIITWTRRLPPDLQTETDKILLDAVAVGADADDLRTIVAAAIESWRSQRPDADEFDFKDRHLRLGTTFGGAGVIRGDLTPECAAAVAAVLEALGKKRGAEDDRNQAQRFHDALLEACQQLIRARMVPARAGADTQVIVHIPLSQLRAMPGADELEDQWLHARLGSHDDPGTAYLSGKDAETAACDSLTVPVVTGHADMSVIDKIIALAAARGPAKLANMSPGARRAHRYAIARLAIDFVSGPGGIASALRGGLLEKPWRTPSLPLDIGYAESIPASIRRAVILRDRHCAWPGGCDRPASASDVHHIRHKQDGGETSVSNCGLFCNYHHDVCIHRWGWHITLLPDGTMEARSPDGTQMLRSHAPPGNT
jgi:hypothetical protein